MRISKLIWCSGYETVEIHTDTIEDRDGNIISKKTNVIKKQVPPSVSEIISYLCKHAPDRWRIVPQESLNEIIEGKNDG